MTKDRTNVQNALFAIEDPAYRAFHCKLIPTVPPEAVIGVRTPALRAYAKKFGKTPDAAAFLHKLPHSYYEENNLHAFLIEQIRDFSQTIAALDTFLPYVNNWATCDMMCPKSLTKQPEALIQKIEEWIKSPHEYTVRFAVGLLMRFYLDERFEPAQLQMVCDIHRDEYYINMMIAWYFATALFKQYEAAFVYIKEGRLPLWTHNKAIQKAIESSRISAEQKSFLRALKRKE